jgi:DNA-binding CsgD family transcriptional regulator
MSPDADDPPVPPRAAADGPARATAARNARLPPLLAAAEALAALGSWETDLRTGATVWSDGLYRLLSVDPSDEPATRGMIVAAIHAGDRERIGRLLEAVEADPDAVPAEGVYAAFRIARPDGTLRDVRGHGRIERDAAGHPSRWVGALQDVTEEVLTERELHARYGVSQTLREWESFEEGVVGLLRRLGTALDYAYASLWIWDPGSERIVCRAFWSAPDLETGEFEVVTRALAFRLGEGIPGKVWVSGAPAASRELGRDPDFRRADVALAAGLTSTLAFPAVGPDGTTLAVLIFYSADPRDPSARLLRTLGGIGSELGRFFNRRRGDLEARRLSERELEVLRLAAEGNSGPDIAERLVLSPSTIKTHFENIYEKLGVGDRAAAVAHALRLGLIR